MVTNDVRAGNHIGMMASRLRHAMLAINLKSSRARNVHEPYVVTGIAKMTRRVASRMLALRSFESLGPWHGVGMRKTATLIVLLISLASARARAQYPLHGSVTTLMDTSANPTRAGGAKRDALWGAGIGFVAGVVVAITADECTNF